MKRITARMCSLLLIVMVVLLSAGVVSYAEDTENKPITINFQGTHRLIDASGQNVDLAGLTYKLNVTDDYGNVITTATAGSDGVITFDKPLVITKTGRYQYYLTVDGAASYPGVIFDGGYYTMSVTVGKDYYTPQLFLDYYEVTYSDWDDEYYLSGSRYEYQNNLNYSSYDLSFTDSDKYKIDRPVTNLKLNTTDLTVKKSWDNTDKTEPVTVDLMRNGEVFDTQVLSEDNSWTYTWSGLVVNEADGNAYSYEVIERTPEGYVAEYYKRTAQSNVEAKRYWVPLADGEKTVVGEKYIIISGDYRIYASSSNESKAYYFTPYNDRKDNYYTYGIISNEVGSYCINGSFDYTWSFVEYNGNTVLRYYNGLYLTIDPNNYGAPIGYTREIEEATPVWVGGSFLGASINDGHYNNDYMISCYETYGDIWRCLTLGKGTSEAGRFFKIKEVRSGQIAASSTITITNSPVPENYKSPSVELNIIKKSMDTEEVLAGAVYTVYDEDGNVIGSTEPTDSEGKTSFAFDKAGKYTVKETKAPEGYELNDEAYDVEVAAGEQELVCTPAFGRGQYTYAYSQELLISSSLEDGVLVDRDEPVKQNPSKEGSDEDKDKGTVVTGDNSQIYFYGMMLLASCLGIMIALRRMVKRR